jgi:hypothetical protein
VIRNNIAVGQPADVAQVAYARRPTWSGRASCLMLPSEPLPFPSTTHTRGGQWRDVTQFILAAAQHTAQAMRELSTRVAVPAHLTRLGATPSMLPTHSVSPATTHKGRAKSSLFPNRGLPVLTDNNVAVNEPMLPSIALPPHNTRARAFAHLLPSPRMPAPTITQRPDRTFPRPWRTRGGHEGFDLQILDAAPTNHNGVGQNCGAHHCLFARAITLQVIGQAYNAPLPAVAGHFFYNQRGRASFRMVPTQKLPAPTFLDTERTEQ